MSITLEPVNNNLYDPHLDERRAQVFLYANVLKGASAKQSSASAVGLFVRASNEQILRRSIESKLCAQVGNEAKRASKASHRCLLPNSLGSRARAPLHTSSRAMSISPQASALNIFQNLKGPPSL